MSCGYELWCACRWSESQQTCIINDSQPWSTILGSDDCDLSGSQPCNAFKKSNVYFHNSFLLKSLLRHLIKSQSFSLGLTKRGFSRYFLTHGITSHWPPPILKPSALNVFEMFGPVLSSSILPHTIFNLIIWRASISPVVLGATLTLPNCYFSHMLRWVTHGWHIPCDYSSITPLYKVKSKYPAVLAYSDHVAKELDKMCATRVLHPIALSSVNFYTPINAVIKNSIQLTTPRLDSILVPIRQPLVIRA